MRALRCLLGFLALAPVPALAGPPYATDDPEPTETRHWEVYSFVDADFNRGEHAGAFGLDLNYGALHHVQLTATVPFEFDSASGNPARLGDVELGVKWQFLADQAHHRSIAFFPRVVLPTGADSTRANVLLPVWGQQEFGDWAVFGGGGYMIHPGPGNRDFWQEGLAVTRHVARDVTIGVEAFHEGAEAVGGHGSTRIAGGIAAHVAGPFSLLLSAGPQIQDATGETAASGYLALQSQF